ncbi:MAG: T9SS type A sorting domain-containing protein, partial [Candidatus Cloacimonetes bacterium]|nr:T9SS type A sorting domain-containing protein [Candidatus Cloacimonadota bacterium]
ISTVSDEFHGLIAQVGAVYKSGSKYVIPYVDMVFQSAVYFLQEDEGVFSYSLPTVSYFDETVNLIGMQNNMLFASVYNNIGHIDVSQQNFTGSTNSPVTFREGREFNDFTMISLGLNANELTAAVFEEPLYPEQIQFHTLDFTGSLRFYDVDESSLLVFSESTVFSYFINQSSGVGDVFAASELSVVSFPNPLRISGDARSVSSTIYFNLGYDSRVNVAVYDMKGRKISTIYDAFCRRGEFTCHWNGADEQGETSASGVYLYKITTDKETVVKKTLLLK